MVIIVAILALGFIIVPIGAPPASAHRQAVAIPEILRPAASGATRPSAHDLRGHIEEAFQALIDAEAARHRGASLTSQRGALRDAADKIFDWREMTKDALGKHWAHTTPAQRDHVARLMSQLFERLYLPMIERTGPPKADRVAPAIVSVGESVTGNEAVVRMLWKRSARDLGVDWSLRRRAGVWRIRDVALDGISVVENYRAQIDHVIQRSSYEDLVARMENKINSPPLTGPSRITMPARSPRLRVQSSPPTSPEPAD